MKQQTRSAPPVSLAKGLSAHARKGDVTTQIDLDSDAPAVAPAPVEEPVDRKPVRFQRPEFYLKIDGLTGPRPSKRKGS